MGNRTKRVVALRLTDGFLVIEGATLTFGAKRGEESVGVQYRVEGIEPKQPDWDIDVQRLHNNGLSSPATIVISNEHVQMAFFDYAPIPHH